MLGEPQTSQNSFALMRPRREFAKKKDDVNIDVISKNLESKASRVASADEKPGGD